MDQQLRLPREDFELLAALVETARAVPPDRSASFMIVQPAPTTRLALTPLPPDVPVSRRTLEHLVRQQLLTYAIKDGAEHFTVTAAGFAVYDQLRNPPLP